MRRWLPARAVVAMAIALGVVGLAGEASAEPEPGPQAVATWHGDSGTNWTTVRSCSPNTAYWTNLRDAMRVGNSPDNNCVHRVFVTIPLGDDLAGGHVLGANFHTLLDHTAPCGSPTPEIRLSVTAETWITRGALVTWNNTSDFQRFRSWVVGQAMPPSANETGACGRDMGDQPVDFNIPAGDLQYFVDRGYSAVTFQLFAASENTWTNWKKFYPGASLDVFYEPAA